MHFLSLLMYMLLGPNRLMVESLLPWDHHQPDCCLLCTAEWDAREETPSTWDQSSQPAPPAPEQPTVAPDFHKPWARVDSIASLETPQSSEKAADAIAYDMLNAALTSLPAICGRVAEIAAAAMREIDHESQPSMSDEAHHLLQKALLQVWLRSLRPRHCPGQACHN